MIHPEKPQVEHILACLSSSPSNAKIVRTAARMAQAFGGAFTALYVQTPAADQMSAEDAERLRSHICLAEQAGANIVTVCGDDVPYQISEFARVSGVTKVVLGRSSVHRRHFWSGPTVTEKLAESAPNLDIYIIPDAAAEEGYRKGRRAFARAALPTPRDFLLTAALLSAITGVGTLFLEWGFAQYNIIMVYILGVLLTALFTNGYACGVLASVLSVTLFNFFLTEPRLTFHAYDPGYPVTFVIMLVSAMITCTLTARLKAHATLSARAAFRTKVLFETNQQLQKAQDEPDMLSITASQLMKLLERDIIIYPEEGGRLAKGYVFGTAPGRSPGAFFAPQEQAAAQWAFAHQKRAGATAEQYPQAQCLYFSIRTGSGAALGVVGIDLHGKPLEAFENSVVLSILGECALAIENSRNARAKEQAAVRAENEQLRANLLRTISHDLRTPLTCITGNASNLLANDKTLDDAARTQIFTDILDDGRWLTSLVENLLSITRIEDGRMNLQLSPQLMDEVIDEAMRHIGRKSTEHSILVQYSDELLLANMDARLMVQVIINLVDNAIKYTPPGSHIAVSADHVSRDVRVRVADDGPGIPDEAQNQVFEMFFTGQNRIADSRRSLGLGLALCKAIITAHGGTLTLADNQPHGCIFTFTLPQSEVSIHE
ncbi:MAG: DUF4118 domain-containing protein [Faecalibacterium sp.]